MIMKLDIPLLDLKQFVVRQLNNFFPDNNAVSVDEEFSLAFDRALERLENCFSHIVVNGYSIKEDGVDVPFFQHTNSDQYCQFLWFLSNTLWKMYPGKKDVCDKLILLNKMLHGCWFTYKVELPDIFVVVHPVGSVIGHAYYSNYLVICQNVTIGQKEVGDLSHIGEYCFLGTGATIMGICNIGDRTSLGIRATIYNEDLEEDSVVYIDKETGRRTIYKNNSICRAKMYFDKNYHVIKGV